jgi:2-polyprenyl-6-methoxyphenol hydroxylase-like FAD-dependent oxidoreductase
VSERETYDVAVVGAGAAGIAASLSAARSGARVVLIERTSAPGGVVSQALVHTICGLYHPSLEGPAEYVHAGFPQAFAQALTERGGAGAIARAHDAVFLPIEPSAFTALAADYCTATAGLTVLDGCELVSAVLSENPSDESQLRIRSRDNQRTIVARAIVDCSGDATAAALGGARTLQAPNNELQYPSYIFRLDGVDTSALLAIECARTSAVVARAARDGRVPRTVESVLLRPGVEAGSVYVTVNVDKPDPDRFDPLDEEAITGLASALQLTVEDLANFLIAERKPFARARLGLRARRLGVRESRRVAGRVIVCGDHVRETQRRDDEVCRSSWPIELWTSHRKLRFERVESACSVPLGALQSASHPRLAMAGRCLSADHEALGALRVIATSMATGEAAGINAALAVDGAVALGDVEAVVVRNAIAALANAGWSPEN